MNSDPGSLLATVTGTGVRNSSLDTLACLWPEGSFMWVVLGHGEPFEVSWAHSGTASCCPKRLSDIILGKIMYWHIPGASLRLASGVPLHGWIRDISAWLPSSRARGR